MADKLPATLPEMTRYVVSKPNYQEIVARAAKQTPAERLAAVEADPGSMAILKKHGLSAREYLVGVPTLRMALMKAQAGDGPVSDRIVVSPPRTWRSPGPTWPSSSRRWRRPRRRAEAGPG